MKTKPNSLSRHLFASISPVVFITLSGLASVSAENAGIAEEINVIGNAEGGTISAISLTEAQKELNQIPGAIDMVLSESYQNKFTQNLETMLSNTPGVYARQRYAEEVRLSIRGSGVSRSYHLRGIKLLQDGIPLSAADGSGDFQEIDPAAIRYTEVYKGSNALRYGASSLGGAINFVTPTAHTAASKYNVRIEGGSFNTARVHGAISDVFDKADYYISATGATSDGYRTQSNQDNIRLFGNAGFKLSDNAETRFYLTYNNINQQVPGSISLDDALNDPKVVQPVNILNDYQRDVRSIRLSNRTVWAFDTGKLEIGLYGTHKTLFHPIFQVIDQESAEYGASGRLTLDHSIGDGESSFIAGVNAGCGQLDAKRYVNNGGVSGTLTADADQNACNLEIYAEERVEIRDGLHAIVGAQLTYADRDYNDILDPARSADTSFTGLSPKFGLLWNRSAEMQFFANVSRSYETPTYSELVQFPVAGFVPLDAQRAWTVEMGTRGTEGNMGWDISLYRSWVKGEMLQFTVDPNIPAGTFNAGKTIHQGIEAGIDWQVRPDLKLRQTYTFSDFKFQNDTQYGDNRIPGVPRHAYHAELDYIHASGVQITPSIDWTIKDTVVDYANSFKAPNYVLLGISASYQMSDNMALFVDGRNLLDRQYVSDIGVVINANGTGANQIYYPGDGRAVFLGARWKM